MKKILLLCTLIISGFVLSTSPSTEVAKKADLDVVTTYDCAVSCYAIATNSQTGEIRRFKARSVASSCETAEWLCKWDVRTQALMSIAENP